VQAGDIVIYSDACPTAPEVLMAKEIHATFLEKYQNILRQLQLRALVPQLDQKNYWANETIKDDLQAIFTYILGGKSTTWDESLRKKYRFLIEADEFNRHFLYLDVDHAIILNAELDHSDIYENEEVYLQTYVQFIHKVKQNVFAITDYGHHPTEINAVYQAMRAKYPEKKLVAIFQPHQARRVLQFRKEFASTMQQFDEVTIYDIYAARENLEELLHSYPIPGADHGVDSIDEL
ncbi:unnamed protein product, partial [Darwinula stevensoni]